MRKDDAIRMLGEKMDELLSDNLDPDTALEELLDFMIEDIGMLPPCLNLSTGGDFTSEDCQQMADDYEGDFSWYEDSYEA